eukprot:XP_008675606.1 uncharacterized protein LOC103651676 isoform X1 [Zea mays]
MSVSASTRPVAAALGAAAFEEALTLRSPVYFSRGAKAVVKYEPRAFAVSVAASTLDLGKHDVDLTRLLPLSFDDLEDGGDSGFGKWSTSFRLSGPARGARLNVTFSCSLLKHSLSAVQCILPKEWEGIYFGGLGRAVMYLDLDCRFDVLRLAQILRNRIAEGCRLAHLGNGDPENDVTKDEFQCSLQNTLFSDCMQRFLYARCCKSPEFIDALKVSFLCLRPYLRKSLPGWHAHIFLTCLRWCINKQKFIATGLP